MPTTDEVLALIAEAERLRALWPTPPPPTPRARWSLDASAETAHLYLYDGIGGFGISASEVVEQVRAVATRPLLVHLNSPGGDVFAGLAIHNTLKHHGAPVAVRIEGLAASIASVIAMAGSSIQMARASLLMIHEARGFTLGTAHDHRAMASLLDKASDVMADIYAKRGGERDAVRAWMHAEKWFKPGEALDAGLIDTIDDEPVAAEARSAFDLSGFRHAPSSPLAAPAASAPPRARERARLLVQVFDNLAAA